MDELGGSWKLCMGRGLEKPIEQDTNEIRFPALFGEVFAAFCLEFPDIPGPYGFQAIEEIIALRWGLQCIFHVSTP